MTSIINEFLSRNPYFVLSFLIALYFVSCYAVCENSIYKAIESIKNKEENKNFFAFSQLFLQILCVIITKEILNMNIYLEILIGVTIHSIIFTLMMAAAFINLPKEIKESLIKEDIDY